MSEIENNTAVADSTPEAVEEEKTEGASTAEDGSEPDQASKVRRLEEEGEIAADYLEELLDITDLDGDIDIDVDGDRASVAILSDNSSSSDLKTLTGRQGQVLEALQELTRLAVQSKTGNRSRLMLDIGNYRSEQRTSLQKIATDAIRQATSDRAAVALKPMNPFERKIVHDVVAEAGLISESEGEGQQRHVVVRPGKDD